jgi:hypothetical protein
MTTLRIRADVLAHTQRFAYDCDGRPSIQGVRVEPAEGGGVVAVATDGHRMFVAHDPAGFIEEPAVLRLDGAVRMLFLDCRRAAPPALVAEYPLIAGGPSRLTVEKCDPEAPNDTDLPAAVWVDVILTGSGFPDWRRMFDVFAPSQEQAGFQARYLSDFKDAACWAGGAANAPMRIISGGDGPALVQPTYAKYAQWCALLMPMRFECPADLPAFVRRIGSPT